MKNYKLKKYKEKGLIYAVLDTQKGEPNYNGKTMDAEQMAFEDVKLVMKSLAKGGDWENIKYMFGLCFGVEEGLDEWFWNGNVKEFYQARNYIIKEFNRLIKREQTLLKSINVVDTILWEQAGGNKLNRFGGVLTLNQLGKLYGVYPFDLSRKKYIEILYLLTIEKETGEMQAKYNELKGKIKTK